MKLIPSSIQNNIINISIVNINIQPDQLDKLKEPILVFNFCFSKKNKPKPLLLVVVLSSSLVLVDAELLIVTSTSPPLARI